MIHPAPTVLPDMPNKTIYHLSLNSETIISSLLLDFKLMLCLSKLTLCSLKTVVGLSLFWSPYIAQDVDELTGVLSKYTVGLSQLMNPTGGGSCHSLHHPCQLHPGEHLIMKLMPTVSLIKINYSDTGRPSHANGSIQSLVQRVSNSTSESQGSLQNFKC